MNKHDLARHRVNLMYAKIAEKTCRGQIQWSAAHDEAYRATWSAWLLIFADGSLQISADAGRSFYSFPKTPYARELERLISVKVSSPPAWVESWVDALLADS